MQTGDVLDCGLMSAFFLLPALISVYLVIRGRIETAFLSVYLPCLLLLPDEFALRLPHAPPISAAHGALIPIGIVALYRLARSGLPSIMDVLLVLSMISTFATEVLRERVMNDGILSAMTSFIAVFLAYAVGRKIVEPGLRFETIRRWVILVLLLGIPGLVEWRLGQSVFGIVGERVFKIAVVPMVQIRSGHGRMEVSLSDAELAGIVFGMTLSLNAWLLYLNKAGTRANFGRVFAMLEKYHLPSMLLFVYVLLTQSRGPLIAVGAAFLVLQIVRFKNTKLATFVVAAILATGAYGAKVYLSRYTDVADPSAITDERQGSAIYRRQMNEIYKPIVAAGGFLGWGVLSRPVLQGQFSIDNEFLLIHLCYGDFGYFVYVLIAAENIRRLVVRSWSLKSPEDRAFAICMLGAMTVFWVSVTTVFMGNQLPQIAFLLIGWSESIVPGTIDPVAIAKNAERPKFVFKRVLT